MSKLCGIEQDLFKQPPTPAELGVIVAHFAPGKIAEFLMCLGEALRNSRGHYDLPMQWEFIGEELRDLELELCDGSGSELLLNLARHVAPKAAQP